jgi:hypothetical protein
MSKARTPGWCQQTGAHVSYTSREGRVGHPHAACDDLGREETPLSECALAQLDRVGESHPVVLTVLEEALAWQCAQATLLAFGQADWPTVRIGIFYAREVAQRGGGAGDGLPDLGCRGCVARRCRSRRTATYTSRQTSSVGQAQFQNEGLAAEASALFQAQPCCDARNEPGAQPLCSGTG